MLLSLSNAFIKRPVLSTVCTIVIILLGTISMAVLPLDKLPEIAPKKVAVTANYIAADAKTTEELGVEVVVTYHDSHSEPCMRLSPHTALGN